MGTTLIMLLIMAVITAGIMYALARWAANYVQHFIEDKLIAIDQIVNEEKVPDKWSQPFTQRIEKLEQTGGKQKKIAQVKEKAKARCIRNLEELITYADKANLASDQTAKSILLQALNQKQEMWQEQMWDEMITAEKPSPDDEVTNPSQNME